MRKDVLYESVKKFVKTRKVNLSAFFTGSLRNRKFKISCCVMKELEKSSCAKDTKVPKRSLGSTTKLAF